MRFYKSNHPILGGSQEFAESTFESACDNLTVENGVVKGEVTYQLSDTTLEELIQSEHASVVIITKCRPYFQEEYRFKTDQEKIEITIPVSVVGVGQPIDLNCYIVANKEISNYTNPQALSVWGQKSFRVSAGMPLAETKLRLKLEEGHVRFKSHRDFIKKIPDDSHEGPPKIFEKHDFVELILSRPDFEELDKLERGIYSPVAHLLVFTIVLEIAHRIHSNELKDDDFSWVLPFQNSIDCENIDDLFENVAKWMNNPISRVCKHLNELELQQEDE